jgi:hypothetical protein
MPADVDNMTYGELNEFVDRLAKCPPVGAVFQVVPKE